MIALTAATISLTSETILSFILEHLSDVIGKALKMRRLQVELKLAGLDRSSDRR
jgi:hypothetical protein